MEVNAEDVERTKGVLGEVEHRAKDCSALIRALAQKIKNKEISTNKGISFLEVKNNLLLQYIMGLGGVVLTKLRGRSINGHSLIDQLIELRVVLEKMRPIDNKLKYQVDKLIRSVTEKKTDTEADPLMHRANLDNLSDNDSEDDDEERPTSSKKDVYQPPKVAATPYEDEEATPAKQMEKARKKTINKLLIKEMQEEFLDTPIEISNRGEGFADQYERHAKDKQRYEETYMTRLPETKRDKHMQKSLSTIGVLGDEITNFKPKRSGAGAGGKKNNLKRKKSGGGSVKKRLRKK